MEVELRPGNSGIPGVELFVGRSIKRSCPICSSTEKDQLWMESISFHGDDIKVEGVAWCPCGTMFYYSTLVGKSVSDNADIWVIANIPYVNHCEEKTKEEG